MAQDNTRKTLQMNSPQNLEEQVRQRAYEIYEARGREDGHELEDWLTAEKEVTTSRARIAAA